jgi:hypothetical protein
MMFPRNPTRMGRVLLTAAALVVVTPHALAAPSAADRETARALMRDGDKAFDAKDFAAALKHYQAAHALVGLPSTGLWLAKAHAARGELVEAHDVLTQARRIPADPNENAPNKKARAEIDALAQALAPRVPSLVVVVKGPASSDALEVRLDGALLPVALVGLPRKVNPGTYEVSAVAPGHRPAKGSVQLGEGETKTLELVLEADQAPTKPPQQPDRLPEKVPERVPEKVPERPREPAGPAPLVVAGAVVGGLGLAAGVVGGAASLGVGGSAKASCVAEVCPTRVQGDVEAARGLAWMSNVGFGVAGVGAVLLVVGAVTRPSSSAAPAKRAASWSAEPLVGLGLVGVRGVFR